MTMSALGFRQAHAQGAQCPGLARDAIQPFVSRGEQGYNWRPEATND